MGMVLHRVEGEVEGVPLEHYLVSPQAWVEEEHLVPFLGESSYEGRVGLVLGSKDVLRFEVGPHIHLQFKVLFLQRRDGPIGALVLPEDTQFEPGSRGVLVAGGAAGLSREAPVLVLLHIMLVLPLVRGEVDH